MTSEELEEYTMEVGDSEDDEDNVLRTSLVNNPATQKLFAVFEQQKNNPNFDFKVVEPTPENKQVVAKGGFSRIISGVWFMPDTDYLRFDWETGAFFTTRMERSELKKAVTNFAKNGLVNEFNLHHDTDSRPPEGLIALETWILDDYKEVSPILKYSIETLGYSAKDIPLGTVFMSVFVSNEQFFNDKILSGEVKGFSIEGFFKLTRKKQEKMSKNKEMFGKIGLIQDKGTLIFEGGKQLVFSADGKVLEIDSASTTGGMKTAANGDYKTSFGFQVVVRDGKVSDFGFEEVPADADAAAKAAADAATQKAAQDAANKAEADRKAAEQAAKPEKTSEQIIEEKVAAILAKKEADKAAADAAKAAKDAEKAAHDKEIADLKAERDAALKNTKIPKPTTVNVADVNKETHDIKKVGGREMAVRKR